MQQQLRAHRRSRERECQWAHRRDRANGAIRQRIRQRTQPYHEQQLDAIMFQHHRQRRESLVIRRHPAHEALEEVSAREETRRRAHDARARDDEPAFPDAKDEACERDAG